MSEKRVFVVVRSVAPNGSAGSIAVGRKVLLRPRG